MSDTPQRRSRGEGHIGYRDSDQRFYASLTYEKRRRTVYGRTRQEVAEKLTELQRQRDAGRWHVQVDQTLAEILDAWLDSREDAGRTHNTMQLYRTMASRLKAELGSVRVDRLQPQDIQALYRRLEKSGTGLATITYLHRVLSMALNQAMRWRVIEWNPASAVELRRHQAAERQTLSRDELLLLFEQTRGTRWHAAWVLMGTAGLRLSECLGLLWSDIDTERRIVHVTEQLEYRRKGGYYRVPLKTASSIRDIHLSDIAMDALHAHRAIQGRDEARATSWRDIGLVFATAQGSPLSTSVVASAFARDILRQSLVGLTPHCLRHTAITLLLADGVPLPDVARFAGHKNPTTTLRIYSHAVREHQEQIGARMDAILRPRMETGEEGAS